MIVETLAIGTELLLGQVVNTNATTIGSRLAQAGLDHFHQTVVGDNLDRAVSAIRLALSRADAVIVTGGIGPTKDDVTREVIGVATGLPLVFDEDYAETLRGWWVERGETMPDSNLRQAYNPEGAEMILNLKGTAPGVHLEHEGTWIFSLPGVPAEMLPMMDDHVIPFLQGLSDLDDAVVVSRMIRTWGESEAWVGELLDDLFEAGRNPTIAFLASAGEIKIRVTAKAATDESANALIAPVEKEIRRRMGPRVFGVDDDTVEQVVLMSLLERGWTVGTAESASGGLIAGKITSIPGSSAAFRGSVVAYNACLKQRLLGVPLSLIDEHGAVSEPVAEAMAVGAAELLGADCVIATTGAAGPDPHDQAAGTMIVCVRTPELVRTRTLQLPGDRERVRAYTVTAALHHLRLAMHLPREFDLHGRLS